MVTANSAARPNSPETALRIWRLGGSEQNPGRILHDTRVSWSINQAAAGIFKCIYGAGAEKTEVSNQRVDIVDLFHQTAHIGALRSRGETVGDVGHVAEVHGLARMQIDESAQQPTTAPSEPCRAVPESHVSTIFCLEVPQGRWEIIGHKEVSWR